MARKTIGGLYVNNGAAYFIKYCTKCHESVYWNKEEALEFMKNASRWIHYKQTFFQIIKEHINMPIIKVEWQDRGLTGVQGKEYNRTILTEIKMAKIKLNRNTELLKKQKEGWSFRQLAEHFNITVSRTYEIYKENQQKNTAFRAVHK